MATNRTGARGVDGVDDDTEAARLDLIDRDDAVDRRKHLRDVHMIRHIARLEHAERLHTDERTVVARIAIDDGVCDLAGRRRPIHGDRLETIPLTRVVARGDDQPRVGPEMGHHDARGRRGRNVDVDSLVVTDAHVDGGPMFKRIRPRARGMAYMIRKRFSHIHVTLEEV